jgi:hypothetical protein
MACQASYQLHPPSGSHGRSSLRLQTPGGEQVVLESFEGVASAALWLRLWERCELSETSLARGWHLIRAVA